MTREKALKLVVEAAQHHVDYLYRLSFSYERIDPREGIYKEALEVIRREFNVDG